MASLAGDLDNNGKVTRHDGFLYSLWLEGAAISDISPLTEEEFLSRADFNGDGVINVLDTILFGQVTEFDPWAWDKNKNCYIDADENLDAVDAYIAGWITEAQRKVISDLYTNHTVNPACGAPLGFLPSSRHIAHVPVSNPTASEWTYDAELYLVKDSTKYGGGYSIPLPNKVNEIVYAGPTIDIATALSSLVGDVRVKYVDYDTKATWLYFSDPAIGDVNDDGVVDSADITCLELYMLGYPISGYSPLTEEEFIRRGDINGDGLINSTDISLVELMMLEYFLTQLEYGKTYTITLSTYPQDWLIGGMTTFTLAPGQSKIIDFPVTMPSEEGTYKVYLDVYVAGELIAAYIATEDITVAAPVEGFTYSDLFCDTEYIKEDAYGGIAHLIYRATITNPSGVTQSRRVRLKFYSYEYDTVYDGVDSFDLSLGPFGSHDYDYQRDFEGLEWQIQNMRSGTVYDVWIEDDGGGKSDVISITAK